ncbi:MAG: oligosaccharide flippase family protein [Flavobacterium sp.]|nr:oligosaccharide flippase family protein [Flavobacterium sp.]
MGIVINQSIRNTVITYVGFILGAANALFFYTHFLGKTYYGLTAFLLSSANILMPLMAFGVHNTLVKYYSTYKTPRERSDFLTFMLVLPLVLILPLTMAGFFAYDEIARLLAQRNPIILEYVWLIPVIGLFMGYFEIFYAWVKVHFLSVYGSFVKEILLRVFVMAGLFAVFFEVLSVIQFIYLLAVIYFVAAAAMAVFAFSVRLPSFRIRFPENSRSVLIYSLFIILSGSVAVLLLDIDKFMLGLYINIDNVAYYSVAIFIATVVAVPSRAMHQIVYPITAQLMSDKKYDELNVLYKKSSVSLQLVGGYVLLGILVNIKSIYNLLPPEYGGGIFVVFMIGISRYFDLLLGNNNAIIFNSKYYKMVLFLGLLLAVLAVSLNMIFIPAYGIDGAAIATIIAIGLYSLAKLLFVVIKMKLYPFTQKTLVLLAISAVGFLLFYFWDFRINPILDIVLKSALLTVYYVYMSYRFSVLEEANLLFDKALSMIRRP